MPQLCDFLEFLRQNGEKHCFARKNELIYHKVYETRDEAIKDVVRYIEIFYNRQRIQKGLGFKSPTQVFEDFYHQAA